MTSSVSDHQANERTYLAWLRTAISLMGFGFVIAKFGLFLRIMAPTRAFPRAFSSGMIGVGLVVVGGLIACVSAFRYRAIQRAIDRGTYEPAPWPMWTTSVAMTILALLLVVYLFESTWN
jgi:putative membrane protein